MSIINLSGIAFNVVYIDPSISSPGSGDTPLTALSDLPPFSELQSNTAYLIRRLGKMFSLSFPSGSSSVSSLSYAFIGMPKSTDPMYEMIPSEAKIVWDSDSSSIDYAFANVSGEGFSLSGSNVIFNAYRLYLYHENLSSSAHSMFDFSSSDYTDMITFENCKFGYKGYEIDQDSLSLIASEISDQKQIHYEVTGAGESSCNGKYFLLSGTHGDTTAVYQNISSNCKIFFKRNGSSSEDGYWSMYHTIGDERYYYSYGSITGSWYSNNGSYPEPTVTELSGTFEFKVRVLGGANDENGDYYLSSGTHGTTSATYSNFIFEIYHENNKWKLKRPSSASPEFEGGSSLYGEYVGETKFSSLPSYGMNAYISCEKVKSFEFRGCRININYNSSTSSSCKSAVRLNDKRICTISDCDIFTCCYSESYSYSSYHPILLLSYDNISSQYDILSYTKIYNLNFKIFKHSTSSGATNYLPFCLYNRRSSFLEAKHISIDMLVDKQIGSESVSSIELRNYKESEGSYNFYGMISFYEVENFDVNEISISLPQFWKTTASTSDSSALFMLIEQSGYEGSSSIGYNCSIGSIHSLKSISITCAQGTGDGTYDGIDSSNETGNYYSNIAHETFGQPTCCMKLIKYKSAPWSIENVSIVHPHGVALEISGCWIELDNVQGTVRANSSILSISNLSTWYAGKAISVFNNSTVKIDNLVFGDGGSSSPADEFACMNEAYSNKSFIYVGTSNRQMLSDSRSSSSSYSNKYSVICANEKFTGRYTLRTENCVCMTYGIFRTSPLSPVPATLRLQNNMCSSQTALELGQNPFGGFKKTPETTGRQILNVYGAALDFGELSTVLFNVGRNVLVEVIIPTVSGRRSILSTSGSWILDTTSIWSDSNISATDPESTGFPLVLMLPIEVEIIESPIDIKIYYNWYSTNGSFFLDPFFTLS